MTASNLLLGALAGCLRGPPPPPPPAIVQIATPAICDASGNAIAHFAAPPTAGSVLVALVGYAPSASTQTMPAGFAAGPSSTLGGSHPAISALYRVADGSESSVAFSSGYANLGGIEVYEIAHVGTAFAAYLSATAQSVASASFAVPPVSPTGAAVVLTAGCNYTWSSDAQISAPWAKDCLMLNARGLLCAHQLLAGAGAVSGAMTRSGGGNSSEVALLTLALQQ